MKKVSAILLSLALLLSLVACDSHTFTDITQTNNVKQIDQTANSDKDAENVSVLVDESVDSLFGIDSDRITTLDDELEVRVEEYLANAITSLSSCWETLSMEIDTYKKYCDNAEKISDFYQTVVLETEQMCIILYDYSATFVRAILDSDMSADDKYDAVDVINDYIYEDACDEIHDEIYEGILDDMYDYLYEGILNDAKDNVNYSDWYDVCSDEYDQWYDTSSEVYDLYYKAASDIYSFYYDMSSEDKTMKQKINKQLTLPFIVALIGAILMVACVFLPYSRATEKQMDFIDKYSDEVVYEEINLTAGNMKNVSLVKYACIYNTISEEYIGDSSIGIFCIVLVALVGGGALAAALFVLGKKPIGSILFGALSCGVFRLVNFSFSERGVIPSDSYNWSIAYMLFPIAAAILLLGAGWMFVKKIIVKKKLKRMAS